MTKYIALAQTKGGCGKSTIAISLGRALSEKYKVLIVDADAPQSTCSSWGVTFSEKNPDFKNLSFISCDHVHQYARILETSFNQYDVVISDLPPRDFTFINTALGAVDLAIIPSSLTTSEIWAIQDTAQIVSAAKLDNENLKAMILWNKIKPTKFFYMSKELISESVGLPSFDHELKNLASYDLGDGVCGFDSRYDTVRQSINNLTDQVVKLLNIGE